MMCQYFSGLKVKQILAVFHGPLVTNSDGSLHRLRPQLDARLRSDETSCYLENFKEDEYAV